jgi:RNA polymerase sigma-70 factor, ECF subfamily
MLGKRPRHAPKTAKWGLKGAYFGSAVLLRRGTGFILQRMRMLTDEALVTTYRQSPDSPQSKEAVNELFRRHVSRVSLWCYRISGNRETAADLGQEVLLKAFRSLESFRGDSKFTTWLYTITRNHCFNAQKARAARPEDDYEPMLLDTTAHSGPGPEVALERQRKEQLLRDLMQSALEPIEAHVMHLHYGEEVSLDSITRLLRLTNASGAKAYIVSARRKLARAISEQGLKTKKEVQRP